MSELKATTNAGTIDDPIPQELIWKDAQGKFYKVAGTGGSAPNGGGIVKDLSDAIDDDRNRDTKVAATPLAVKTVNDKIGELATLLTNNKDTVVDAINELFQLAGNEYIATPVFITPLANAANVSVITQFVATPFKCTDPSATRQYRIWQVDTTPTFNSDAAINHSSNTDSFNLGDVLVNSLKPNTKYYARCCDVTNSNMIGGYGAIEFTTGDNVTMASPTVTLKGVADSPDNIATGLTIEVSDVKAVDPENENQTVIDVTHTSTTYTIVETNARATNVWEQTGEIGGGEDLNNLKAKVPDGTLKPNTTYTLTVTVNGKFNMGEAITSGVTVKQFTTIEGPKVQAPVITIAGTPDNVSTIPTINGGVFSVSNGTDTHAGTELKILLSENMSEVYTISVETPTVEFKIPSNKLNATTQYKVQMRYKGLALGWSEWGELSFTTGNNVTKYNYIGVPGTSTFGVGLAEEKDYNAVQLAPAEKCFDPTDFQYGLYVKGKFDGTGDGVAMKWIPKFYIKQLQKNEGTVNLTDEELTALLPYVEVTLEQMKEAQRRSPHNALVVAPADRFTDEADANTHGFYLMRGFIDGGKEYNGFFIANVLARYRYNANDQKFAIECGYNTIADTIDTSTTYSTLSADKLSVNNRYFNIFVSRSVGGSGLKSFALNVFSRTPYQCTSAFAWAVISILSLIQGQYAINTNDCAWYDSQLITNFPKGINSTNKDVDDNNVVSNFIGSYPGNVFVIRDQYSKTTHNGSITGVTNVNGWHHQGLVGVWGNCSKVLKRSASIYDVTFDNVETNTAPYFEDKDISKVKSNWGGNKSSLPNLDGNDAVLFGLMPFGDASSPNSNEFGLDEIRLSNGSMLITGGEYNIGTKAGVFKRVSSYWYSNNSYDCFRAMAYPRELPVTVTANCPEGTPSTQTVVVPKGTTLGEAKKKLVTPTATNKVFKEWRV